LAESFADETKFTEKPMNAIPPDCLALDEAVTARAENTLDYELEREFGDYASFSGLWNGPGARPYLCREFAVRELYRGLSGGSIDAYIEDARSGTLMRIRQGAWQNHALWSHTIRGGMIHATACDDMEEFNGRSVFLKRSAVEQRLTDVRRLKPAALKATCQAWLEDRIRATPGARPKPKRQLLQEAKAKFRVTWREFDECWKLANQAVPESTWRRPGAPKKS
jgi:hypothetical protein